MERLNFTPNVLRKANIPFDIIRKGDVMNSSELRIRDVYSSDCSHDNVVDIFSQTDNVIKEFLA